MRSLTRTVAICVLGVAAMAAVTLASPGLVITGKIENIKQNTLTGVATVDIAQGKIVHLGIQIPAAGQATIAQMMADEGTGQVWTVCVAPDPATGDLQVTQASPGKD